MKEALVTQADNFVDRPYSPMVTRIYSGNSGESQQECTNASATKKSGHLLSHTSVILAFFSFQQVFSLAMGRYGGDSDVLP